jgi:hypothetical protein
MGPKGLIPRSTLESTVNATVLHHLLPERFLRRRLWQLSDFLGHYDQHLLLLIKSQQEKQAQEALERSIAHGKDSKDDTASHDSYSSSSNNDHHSKALFFMSDLTDLEVLEACVMQGLPVVDKDVNTLRECLYNLLDDD